MVKSLRAAGMANCRTQVSGNYDFKEISVTTLSSDPKCPKVECHIQATLLVAYSKPIVIRLPNWPPAIGVGEEAVLFKKIYNRILAHELGHKKITDAFIKKMNGTKYDAKATDTSKKQACYFATQAALLDASIAYEFAKVIHRMDQDMYDSFEKGKLQGFYSRIIIEWWEKVGKPRPPKK